MKLRVHLDDPMTTKVWPSPIDKHNNGLISSARSVHGGTYSGSFQNKKADVKSQGSSQGHQRKDAFNGSEPPNVLTQSGLAVARKRRVHAQVSNWIWFIRWTLSSFVYVSYNLCLVN